MRLAALSIKEIRQRIRQDQEPPSSTFLRELREDPRRGVRVMYEDLRKREGRLKAERRRIRSMQRLERQLRETGARWIAGVDEVGIGPLAGPVVAAAVIFGPDAFVAGVNDSKQLSPRRRRRLAGDIRKNARAVGIGEADVDDIAQLNIYQAGLLAMKRAVCALAVKPDWLLVDGRELAGVSHPQRRVIGGDRLHFVIAAASILAKEHRDRLMCQLDSSYPQYGFARHKGYGTKEHLRAICRHGPSPAHRRSFGSVQELLGEYSALFYRLRNRLDQSKTADHLSRFEAELTELRSGLSKAELKKLRQLLGRVRLRLGCDV